MRHSDPRVARTIEFFEQLSPQDLERLAALYDPGVRFRDPFNDVRGVDGLGRIFRHMFETLDEPRFTVLDAVAQGDTAFLTWDFSFRMRRFSRGPQRIHGGSLLRFGADGRVTEHRDYWDAAEELYEKLPVVGALMRWLKRRAAS